MGKTKEAITEKSTENGKKKRLKNLKKFSSEYQPSKEALSRGQTARHNKERIAREFFEVVNQDGSFQEAKEKVRKLVADEKSLSKESARDVFFAFYIANPKNAEHFVNKFVDGAKGEVDITTDGEKIQDNSNIKQIVNELKAGREALEKRQRELDKRREGDGKEDSQE